MGGERWEEGANYVGKLETKKGEMECTYATNL